MGGHPLVYAQTEIKPERKTLLFYGHYDVQPVDPLDLWDNPPFDPVIKDGVIYARGSSDDKGQVYTHIKALEAYIRTGEELPVNVKFIIEGEEEAGGHSIYRYTEQNPEKLACDAIIVSDTTLYNETTPGICYSLKGLAYMEIQLKGPDMDLHSGSYGGTVQNPGNALCEIVARLKDAEGRCLIPGFYDDVLDLEQDERDGFAELGYTDEILKQETGAPAAFGEAGYTTLERMWARPTCDVNGLLSGYGGEGAKTIIPSRALAKVSMRLVPNQDPAKIAKQFQEYVQSIAPAGVEVEVIDHHGANPVLVPPQVGHDAGRHARPGAGLRRQARVHPRGRQHSHRGHLPGMPEIAGPAAGLRPVHGQHSQPQREVPPEQLRTGNPHLGHPHDRGRRLVARPGEKAPEAGI